MIKTVPLIFDGRVVGNAVVEIAEDGMHIRTTNITDESALAFIQANASSFSIDNVSIYKQGN